MHAKNIIFFITPVLYYYYLDHVWVGQEDMLFGGGGGCLSGRGGGFIGEQGEREGGIGSVFERGAGPFGWLGLVRLDT